MLSPPPFDTGSLARFVDPLPVPAIAQSAGTRKAPGESVRRIPYFRIEMREVLVKVHRDLPPTRVWGYSGNSPGPTFDFHRDQDVFIEWVNLLPSHHLFAVDASLHGAEGNTPQVRTVVHVHGARVAPEYDGFPEAWFTPGKSAVYYYPNRQDAATLWYHDHALGITRLNIFAGLFGAFLIRDPAEESLNLPSSDYEIPLLIYDRNFQRNGSLNYPIGPTFRHPWVPEFSGNSILINGKLFPYLDVEPRRYRFRVINASNGRAFRLSLSTGQPMYGIGGDQGLLSEPVEQRVVNLVAAERGDLVVDFSDQKGQQVVLKNEDRDIMQFRVSSREVRDPSSLPSRLRTIEKVLPSAAVRKRMLTLDEYLDPAGTVSRSLLNGTRWHDPVTERPLHGSVEIWGLINLTKDAHPIHLHAVRFQILDRRPFDLAGYQKTRKLTYTGPAVQPNACEAAWKDIVRADPGMVTRIIVRFDGFWGLYSWHCHILEHEDNEMMRPLEIVGPGHSEKRSFPAPRS